MGKWKNTYNDSRKYNQQWEKEFKWLTFKNGSCYCKLCTCPITKFKKFNLSTHEQTLKHKKCEEAVQKSKSVGLLFENIVPVSATKIFDIKFSVAIACHCSIRSVDHLTEIIKKTRKRMPA